MPGNLLLVGNIMLYVLGYLFICLLLFIFLNIFLFINKDNINSKIYKLIIYPSKKRSIVFRLMICCIPILNILITWFSFYIINNDINTINNLFYRILKNTNKY